MTPSCHNRPEFGPYETASGEIVEHRMSQPCKSWSTGDSKATPSTSAAACALQVLALSVLACAR